MNASESISMLTPTQGPVVVPNYSKSFTQRRSSHKDDFIPASSASHTRLLGANDHQTKMSQKSRQYVNKPSNLISRGRPSTQMTKGERSTMPAHPNYQHTIGTIDSNVKESYGHHSSYNNMFNRPPALTASMSILERDDSNSL